MIAKKPDRPYGVARIRDGAIVGCDCAFWKWPQNFHGTNALSTFAAYPINEYRFRCVRAGFGILHIRNKYGNGALYVNASDLEFLGSPVPLCLGAGI